MLREFTDTMLDSYMTYTGYSGSFMAEHDQIPTGEEVRELQKVMARNGILKRHLTKGDIEKISEVMNK